MRGPLSTRAWARTSHMPAMNGSLWRPRAMTEPRLAAARYAPRARRKASPDTGSHSRKAWGGRNAGAAATENLGAGSGGHVVMFHRDGDEFAGRASAYLLEALRQGGAAIVIASPEHRRAIRARLAQAGTDVAAAEAAGAFVALDALETALRCMVADWPDPASFWEVISPLMRRATEAFKPVRVFGEMVALLWDSGEVNAGIEVEAMWNELAAQYPFSMLCAYPVPLVSGDDQQDSLDELCRVHSAAAGAVPARA
jgi:MEDS: MEthanogen/methylotroph, DcmR Sensory domain